MITENLSTLKIHKLTQEQYERELSAGRIDANALYLTPDEEIDLSPYATVEQLNTKADSEHTHPEATIDTAGLLSAEDKIKLNYGGIPIVTTSGDGAAYTAAVDGMVELKVGMSFMMIPHAVSTTTAPTLNVNNLGAKTIRRRVSNATTSTAAGYNASWLSANKPIMVTYDGLFWIADMLKPSAADVSGTMSVANGGIGKSSVTAGSFLVGDGANAMVEKTPAEALAHMGITATATELNYVDGVTSNVQTQLDAKANTVDLTSHTGNKSNPHGVTLSQLGVNATAAELNYVDGVTSSIQTQLDKKANDFSIEIYNETSGNPKPVRFASFNYSTCNSEAGIAAKISLVSGHGNGTSYAFLEDAIIRVSYVGTVEVDNFKYYGADAGTYDGAARQYGDIFWLIDTTNKIVDFYCLMGQYARVYQTPWRRLTYSTGGTVTQHTSCTVYSSGDKTWANNSDIVLMSDLTAKLNRTTSVNIADTNYTTLMARGTSLNSAETNPAVNGAIAWTYE